MFEPTQNDALFVHIAPISDLCQSFAIYEIATLSYMIGMSKKTNEHTTNSSSASFAAFMQIDCLRTIPI